MRRVLNQTAKAAARTKGSIFEILYRRSARAWDIIKSLAIAHRQCRLIWLILHRCTAEAGSLRRIHAFSGLERTGTQISGECVAVNPGPQAEGPLPRPRFLEKKCRLRGSFDLRRCQAVLTYP
jgi:hypothetical protein